MCIYCRYQLRWLGDFEAEEYGWADGDGIVSEFECDNCGTEYAVYVPHKRKDREKWGGQREIECFGCL